MRVAIVGSGISGMVVASRLHREHEITVFEAAATYGGHTHTVDVDWQGKSYAVDTGFIVFNERNYPHFTALLQDLGVESQPTDMSFGVSDLESGVEYCGTNLNTLFAQRRTLPRPSYVRFLTEIARFNRAARQLVADEPGWTTDDRLPKPGSNEHEEESLADFVSRHGFSDELVQPDVMYWDNWPVRQPSLIFGALAAGREDWLATWQKLDADPQVEEIRRNYPIRQPVLWVR